MKSKIIYILCLSFFGLFMPIGCTAMSSYNSLGGTNTNPTPEYSSFSALIAKGGVIVHNNTVPGSIATDPVGNTNRGEACQISFLALFSGGDSSISRAKSTANIDKVAYVEYNQFAVGGFLFHKFCTIVYGEPSGASVETKVEKKVGR